MSNDWIRTRDKSWTLFGIRCQQVPSGVLWLDRMLGGGFGSILELGTGSGGTTTLFACRYPAAVITCDVEDLRSDDTKGLHARLGVRFVQADLREDRVIDGLLLAARTMTPPRRVHFRGRRQQALGVRAGCTARAVRRPGGGG